MIVALKGFGMKKGPKKQMIFLLQKLKSYVNNKHAKNPYVK